MNTLYYLRLDWFSLTDVQPWIEIVETEDEPDMGTGADWLIRARRRGRR